MSIFDRIRRITKANLTWLMDQVEPPQKELDNRITELSEAIAEGREAAASYGASVRRMENQLADLQAQQSDLHARAADALKAGDEAGAREYLSRKVVTDERIGQLTPGLEQGRKTFATLRENLTRLKDQLAQARMKLADLQARQRHAQAQIAFDKHLSQAAGVAGEGLAFDKFEDEVLTDEARAEVGREMQADSLGDAELAERSRQFQVESQFQQLKDQLEQNQGQ